MNTGVKGKIRKRLAAVLCMAMTAQMVLGDVIPAVAAVSGEEAVRTVDIASPPDARPSGGEHTGASTATGSNADKKQEDSISVGGYLVFMTEQEPALSDVRLQLYVNGKADTSKKAVLRRLDTSASETEEAYLNREMTLEEAAFPVWSYAFENLPIHDEDGSAYTYSVKDAGYPVATPSDAQHAALEDTRPATPSDAQHAVSGDARHATPGSTLYYRGEDGIATLADGEAAEEMADFVYVERRTVEGLYEVENEGQRLPEDAAVRLEVSAEQEEAMGWLDEDVTASVDAEKGLWKAENCPRYNPENGAEIGYRVAVVDNDRDYAATYESGAEYAYAGEIIRNTYKGAGTFRAVGTIRWEDASDRSKLRPSDVSFLKVYDRDGEDVTSHMTVTAAPSDTDPDIWEYEINRLTRGETYEIRTSLVHYAMEDKPLTADAGKKAEVVLPEMKEILKTRTVRGLISWTGSNTLLQRPETLDFMKVYQGTRDVTDLVTCELEEHDIQDDVWGYTLSGLAEGLPYTVRLGEVDGYTVTPSQIQIPAAGMMYRSMRQGEFLEQITIETVEARDVTVKNVTHAKTAAVIAPFEYTVTVKGSGEEAVNYTGEYRIYNENASAIGDKQTAESGSITLSKNQYAVLLSVMEGTTVTVTQSDHATTTRFGAAEQEITVDADTEVNKLTFKNTQNVPATMIKVWNDNENKDGKRPDETTLTPSLTLWYQTTGMSDPAQFTADAMRDLGLVVPDTMPSPTLSNTGTTRWTIIYDTMPYTADNGSPITYTVRDSLLGYHVTWGKGTEIKEDFPYVMNTSYKEMEVTKAWIDHGGAYQTRPTLDELKSNLELHRVDAAGRDTELTMSSEAGEENRLELTDNSAADGSNPTWTIKISNLTAYDIEGRTYTYYLKEGEETLSIATGNTLTQPTEGVHYQSKYENVGNYAAFTDKCYEGGKITNTLTGPAAYTGTKVWQDELQADAKETDRPDGRLQLWRYPDMDGAGPNSATQVGTDIPLQKARDNYDFTAADFIGEGVELPRFDISGSEFIYFVREKLEGDKYKQIVTKKVDGIEQEKGDKLVYNGETIYNRRSEKTSVTITKTWLCAAFQEIHAEVDLALSRRVKSLGDDAVTNPWEPVIDEEDNTPVTETIKDFRAETLTRQASFTGLPQFDDEGREYEYSAEETEIRIAGEDHRMHPVIVDASKNPKEFTTQDGRYSFRMEYDQEDQSHLYNCLIGETEVTVRKVWSAGWDTYFAKHPESPLQAVDLDFHLLRDGQDFCSGTLLTAGETCASPAVAMKALHPKDNQEETDQYITKLPKYDENGAAYEYTIVEKSSVQMGHVTYRYESYDYTPDPPAVSTFDNTCAIVTNSPPGEGHSIPVSKVWLDGSDIQHREAVTVRLYKTSATGVDDYETYTSGANAGKPRQVILSKENGWEGWMGLETGETADEFVLREYRVGTTSGSGESNVTYDSDEFSTNGVIHGEAAGTYHQYDVKTEKKGNSYVITNIRKGTMDVVLKKEWIDGAGEKNHGTSATFKLIQKKADKTPGPDVFDEITLDGTADEQGETAPWNGQWSSLKKYDDVGELYAYSVKETKINGIAIKDSDEEEEEEEEDGRVTIPGTDGNQEVTYSTKVDDGEYHWSDAADTQHPGDWMEFTATNKKVGKVTDFAVHKIWVDEGSALSNRPDIFLTLSREYTKTGDDGIPVTIKESEDKFGYVERTWEYSGTDANDFHWICKFDPLPRYNKDGYEYTYSVVEGSHQWGEYAGQEEYYKETPTDHMVDRTKEQVEGGLTYKDGTIVNKRAGETYVKGEKVWLNAGGLGLKREDYPSVTIQLHKFYRDDTEPTGYEDLGTVADDEGKVYEATLSGAADSTLSYEFATFPKYDGENGKQLYYGLVETAINGDPTLAPAAGDESGIFSRQGTAIDFVINNKWNAAKDYKVEVHKTWMIPSDMTVNGVGYRYPEVWVQLLSVFADAAGEALPGYAPVKGLAQTMNKDSTGAPTSAEFTNLPKIAANGRPYRYSIEERSINGYEITVALSTKVEGGESFTITNTYQTNGPQYTEISGTKTWSDALEPALRPTNPNDVTLTLHRYSEKNTIGGNAEPNLEELKDATLVWEETPASPIMKWTYKFNPGEKQPFLKYAPDGSKYVYLVKEELKNNQAYEMVPGTFTSKRGEDGNEVGVYDFTNKLKPTDLTILKIWDDSNNAYQSRPESITVRIDRRPASDASAAWTTFKESWKISGTNTSTNKNCFYYIKDLPKMAAGGSLWQYCAREFPVGGYQPPDETKGYSDQYDEKPDGSTSSKTSVTNELISTGPTASLKVTKSWNDEENRDGLRPKTITVKLQRDGITLDSAGALTYDVATAKWSPATATWTGLPKYQSDGVTESKYTVVESGYDDKTYTSVVTMEPNVANTGTIATVTNTHTAITDVSVKVKKTWAGDGQWGASHRPAQITVKLYRQLVGTDGQPSGTLTPVAGVDSLVLDGIVDGQETEPWGGTFGLNADGKGTLPYGENGKEILYTVQEDPIPGYTCTPLAVKRVNPGSAADHSITYELTNTMDTTSLKVVKAWSDAGAEFLRPETITVELWRKTGTDGAYEPVPDPEASASPAATLTKTLTKEANGTYPAVLFDKLPAYSQTTVPDDGAVVPGQPYTYQAREIKVGDAQAQTPIADSPRRIGGYQATEVTALVNQVRTTTITNTVVAPVTITVNKTWDDNDNQDGKRPASITVELYKDGGTAPVDKQVISKNADGAYTYTWSGLPKYQDDGTTVCVYRVKEVETKSGDLTPYTCDPGEVTITHNGTGTITNRYTPKTMSVTAAKIWVGDGGDGGDNGAEKLRPEELSVSLQWSTTPGDADSWEYVDTLGTKLGTSFDKTKTIARDADPQTAVWSGLPVCLAGQPVTYRAEEDAVPGYSTKVAAPVSGNVDKASTASENQKSIEITNTLAAKTSAVVQKVWVDSSETKDAIAATCYKLQRKLRDDPAAVYTDVTNAEAGYTGTGYDPGAVAAGEITTAKPGPDALLTFADLPRYDTSGKEYSYRAVETGMRLTTGATVSAAPTDPTDPTKGTVGAYAYEMTSYTQDDTSVGKPGQSTTVVTNRLMLRDVDVTKVWDDAGNQDGKRPASIDVELKKDGESYTPARILTLDGVADTASGDKEDAPWHGVWANLPYASSNGTKIVYTVVESTSLADQGYAAAQVGSTDTDTVTGSNQTRVTVTNSKTPETTSFTVRKYWEGDDDWWEETRPDSIQVQLYKTVDQTRTPVDGSLKTLSASEDWTGTWEQLPKYENPTGTAAAAGESYEILYTAEEVTDGTPGYTPIASGANAIKNTLKTTGLTVEKSWVDRDDYYETRPESITIQLERRLQGSVGDTGWSSVTQIVEREMNRDDDWSSIDFIGLPTHDKAGEAYEYRAAEVKIGEQAVKSGQAGGYRVTYDNTPNVGTVPGTTKITNTLVTTDINGTKTWADQSDKYGLRPESIALTVQSEPEDALVQQPESSQITWEKQGDVWSYRIAGLPKYESGTDTPITYTVEETVDSRYLGSQTAMDITNTLKTGSLEVTKLLTGSSSSAEFTFRVKLLHGGVPYGPYTGDYRIYAKDADVTTSTEYTKGTTADGAILLKGDEKFYIEGLPDGWSYEVTEDEQSSYKNTDKTGDTGVIAENATSKAVFTNEYVPSGGGGGGGNPPGDPNTPGEPGHGGPGEEPPEPGTPTEPGEPGTPGTPEEPGTPGEPGNPDEPPIPNIPEIPVEPNPGGGIVVEFPPDVPPDVNVVIYPPDKPDEPIYEGPLEPGGRVPGDFPPGTYVVTVIDNHDVPLAQFLITIDDEDTPLGLPAAGDSSVPIVWLAVIVLAALSGTAVLRKRRRKLAEGGRENE